MTEELRAVWNSCGHACRGIAFALRSQRNLRIHFIIAALVIAAALLLKFGTVKLVLVILTVTVVIFGELLNTAMEFALNLVEARDHPVVKTAKDIAAGAVFLAVIGAIAIGLLLFGPPLLAFIASCCR